jgi:hypothetical protein
MRDIDAAIAPPAPPAPGLATTRGEVQLGRPAAPTLAGVAALMAPTVAVCYRLSAGIVDPRTGLGRVRADYFYLSSAIDIGLPHRLGGLGVSLAAPLLLLVGCLRFLLLGLLISGHEAGPVAGRLRCCNAAALACVAASSVGMVGIAAFMVSFDLAVHCPRCPGAVKRH